MWYSRRRGERAVPEPGTGELAGASRGCLVDRRAEALGMTPPKILSTNSSPWWMSTARLDHAVAELPRPPSASCSGPGRTLRIVSREGTRAVQLDST